MAKKKAAPKEAPAKEYTASVTVNGKKTTAQADTIYAAIEGLKPGNVHWHAILSVSNGTETKERIVPAILAKRLFNTMGLTREVAIKNASLLFEGL